MVFFNVRCLILRVWDIMIFLSWCPILRVWDVFSFFIIMSCTSRIEHDGLFFRFCSQCVSVEDVFRRDAEMITLSNYILPKSRWNLLQNHCNIKVSSGVWWSRRELRRKCVFCEIFHFFVEKKKWMSKFMYQQKCNRECYGSNFYIGCSKFILLFSKEKSKSKYWKVFE